MKLEDLVTKNRHILNVGLATNDEIAAVAGSIVTETRPCRGVIENWYIIALRGSDDNRTYVSLRGLGYYCGDTWITSDVRAVAVDHSTLRTRNSVYRLGARGIGEPDDRLVRLVGDALMSWGLNEALDLGLG